MSEESIPRLLNLKPLLESRSHFLFGPRQTGKSTLLRVQFPGSPTYNLLDNTLYNELLRNPRLIREEINATEAKVVVIEVVKIMFCKFADQFLRLIRSII